MGNPVRYYFNNTPIIRRPEVNEDKKQLKFKCEFNVEHCYEEAVLNLYSAPDVIYTYTNGNTCQNEWRRYGQMKFKGLKLIKEEQIDYDLAEVTFSFDEYIDCYSNDSSFLESDIPLGKFKGMTLEEVAEYKKNNVVKFKNGMI